MQVVIYSNFKSDKMAGKVLSILNALSINEINYSITKTRVAGKPKRMIIATYAQRTAIIEIALAKATGIALGFILAKNKQVKN